MRVLLRLVAAHIAVILIAISVNAQRGDSSFVIPSKLASKVNSRVARNDIDGALEVLAAAIAKKEDLFEAYSLRARVLQVEKKDFNAALEDINEAIQLRPDAEDAYIRRASIKKQLKDWKGVIADYDLALKFSPRSTDLLSYRAETNAYLKNYQVAVADLDTAIGIEPENAFLRLQRANILSVQGLLGAAAQSLETFLDEYQKQHGGKLPRIEGERVKKKIPSDVKALGRPETPVVRYSQTQTNVRSMNEVDAKMREVQFARDLAKVALTLGELYLKAGDNTKALAALTKAVEIDRNLEHAFGLRGATYLVTDDLVRAIADFSDAIEIADEPYFYLNRGVAYLLSKDDVRAKKDFDKFLTLYPDGKAVLDERVAEARSKLSAQPKAK